MKMDNDGSASATNVFHLQLAFQKLEEEVKLYRNGTTAGNLLELIGEKDREIIQLKSLLTETTNKLRRIAKGSSELIAKCEGFQKERDICIKNEYGLKERNVYLQHEVDIMSEELLELRNIKESLSDDINKSIESIKIRDESIEKLQARCANLVSEKSDRGKLLEKEKFDRSQIIKEFSAQLEKGIKFNTDIKDRLRTEQTTNIRLSSQLAQVTARLIDTESTKRAIKDELEESNASLRAKLQALQTMHDNMSQEVRDTSLVSF